MKNAFKSQHDLAYCFRISRVAEGNFKNLWQLEVKTPNDADYVEIVDADMLSTILSKIGYVFEQEGL
jgi:hypothetical protein